MSLSTRLMKELREAERSTDEDIKLKANDDRLSKWTATICGPEDSPFSGGTFTVQINVPPDYPMVAPTATFKTPIFHPNVHFTTGEICLDILKTSWSPAWTLSSICRAIHTLMCHPEASSPLNCDAGNMLRAGDVIAYNGMARYYAIEKAGAPPLSG
eukprot:PhM_4_TR17234/c0_g1_i1/m.53310/K10689/PEX4; peroxin-4